jgi:hypothetical protein
MTYEWAMGADESAVETEGAAEASEKPESLGVSPMVAKARAMSDQLLADRLSDVIADTWRLKDCYGPYCTFLADQTLAAKKVLLAEYERRQAMRPMPLVEEPVHTPAFARFRSAEALDTWANTNLHGNIYWAPKMYLKTAATTLEGAQGAQWMNAFILGSPILGVAVARQMGIRGILGMVLGAYGGMLAGTLLPLAIYTAAQVPAIAGGEKKESAAWLEA